MPKTPTRPDFKLSSCVQRSLLVAALALVAGVGCVRREITIESDPPGALVWLNDQEIGRTPVTRDFKWYGKYDVELRSDGYETIKTTQNVVAPWWQWVPFDLFAELFPAVDRHKYSFTLRPATQPTEPGDLISRARDMQGQLESSMVNPPATQPATQSASPTTQPATP